MRRAVIIMGWIALWLTPVAMLGLAHLGYNYEVEGYGLHPVLSGIGIAALAVLAWLQAGIIDKLE